MKKTKQFKILLIAAFVAVSSGAFAQVKIGTAPTVIDANSNLEVEAANNKKVLVHKNDGTVVIENTPSGAITDSLLTVDVNGNVHAININKISGTAGMKTTTANAINGGSVYTPNFTAITTDDQGGADLVNNLYTVKISGTYTLSSVIKVLLPSPAAGGRANVDIWLQVNSGSGWTNIAHQQEESNAGAATTNTVTVVTYLNAGDQIKPLVQACSGCLAGTYTLQSGTLYLVRNN